MANNRESTSYRCDFGGGHGACRAPSPAGATITQHRSDPQRFCAWVATFPAAPRSVGASVCAETGGKIFRHAWCSACTRQVFQKRSIRPNRPHLVPSWRHLSNDAPAFEPSAVPLPGSSPTIYPGNPVEPAVGGTPPSARRRRKWPNGASTAPRQNLQVAPRTLPRGRRARSRVRRKKRRLRSGRNCRRAAAR